MKDFLRKILVASFIAVTLIFAILNIYTAYTYFSVYKALKDFNISIREFNLEFLNASVNADTVIGIQNPSESTFHAIYVVERLSLQGEFMFIEGHYLWGNPLRIDPMSNLNVTIRAEITDADKTEWIRQWHKEYWMAEIRVLVDGPLVGTFLHDQWIPMEVTE